ncbi:MAG: hypothetical protein IPK19_04730 [Chloroflexi bacterium]|nr:hypothetical protein [Chloroflexota bacterium]
MMTVYGLTSSDGILYAARTSGLSRSRDGGTTWEETFASLEQAEPLAAIAVASTGQTVFAGVKGAVLRSDDAGDHWTMVGLGSPPPLVVALTISPNFAEDGLVAAGTAEDGVFVSTDRGDTWVAWNFGLLDQSVYALAFSPDFARDRTLYAGAESGVFRSVSAGRGWRETAFPMDAAPVLSLALFGGALVAGTEQHGLFASDGGEHWRP